MQNPYRGPWVVLGRENKIGDIGVGREDESAAPAAVVMERGREGEAKAIAALIAAAPDLFDALVALMNTHPPRTLYEKGWSALQKAGVFQCDKCGNFNLRPCPTCSP